VPVGRGGDRAGGVAEHHNLGAAVASGLEQDRVERDARREPDEDAVGEDARDGQRGGDGRASGLR